MRQVILFDAQDFAALKAGTPLRVSLSDGTTLEIGFDKPRTGRPVSDGAAPPSVETPGTKQTCAHCGKSYASLGSHMSTKHPGKGYLKTGGVKCRWCDKRYPTRSSTLRHEVSQHPERFNKKKGKEPVNG